MVRRAGLDGLDERPVRGRHRERVELVEAEPADHLDVDGPRLAAQDGLVEHERDLDVAADVDGARDLLADRGVDAQLLLEFPSGGVRRRDAGLADPARNLEVEVPGRVAEVLQEDEAVAERFDREFGIGTDALRG